MCGPSDAAQATIRHQDGNNNTRAALMVPNSRLNPSPRLEIASNTNQNTVGRPAECRIQLCVSMKNNELHCLMDALKRERKKEASSAAKISCEIWMSL